MDKQADKEKHSARPIRDYAWPLIWAALLLVLLALMAWLGLRWRGQAAYPGLSPSVPLAADKSYGVNADLSRYSPAELDQALTRMQEMGLSWVRQPFPWARIEPEPGRFDWESWDRLVEAVERHDLQLIAVLDTTPDWARPPDSPLHNPPSELSDFGNFARVLAERYRGRLAAYQVWDEPNLSAHWGGGFVDPLAYARLLREGAINLRAADPGALILLAALAPTTEQGPLNLNEPQFLNELYQAQAGQWFDVVAAQPYGFQAGPDQAADGGTLNFARAQLLRQVMEAQGDGHKPIWATAFGWSGPATGLDPDSSPWPSVSAEQQAAYTLDAVDQGRDNWPWLGPMLFAAWDQALMAGEDPRRGLALVSGAVDLPPASALSTAAPGNRIATVGVYPADHPSGQYEGDWRLSPDGADVPRQTPAQLTIPFRGTRLDLAVRRGAFKGFLYVTIDGQAANALPSADRGSFLVLYDPLEESDTVTLARHLADGQHTARIEAEGGWYQWPLVGWRVSREGDPRALAAGLLVTGLLAAAAAVGLVISARRLPLRDWGLALNDFYLGLGTPLHVLLLAAAALAAFLAPGTLLSALLLGLLLLVMLPRPDLGLALVAFSVPFFLLLKPLAGRGISMTELVLILLAAVCLLRRLLALLFSGEKVGWLDVLSWIVAALAVLCGLMLVLPLDAGLPVLVDWSAPALMLMPLAGVLAAWAKHASGAGRLRLASNPTAWLDLAVLGWVLLGFAASLAAPHQGVAFHDYHVVMWDSAAFYALIRLLRPTPAGGDSAAIYNRRLVDAFLLGSSLMAAYALYQFFFTGQVITAEGVRRALGVYGSPNNLALLLERSLPMLVAMAIFGWRGWPLRRLLLTLALPLTLLALVLTFSRGALWLGLPAALLFIGLVRGRWLLGLAAAGLAVIGAGLAPILGTDRLLSLFRSEGGTGFFRLRLWQSAWAMLGDHPWLGVGPDNFLYQYRTRYLLPDAWQEPNLSHPHNILLDFGTRLGLGGILLLLWLQAAFWWVAAPLYRRLPEGQQRAMILGLMAAMVAALVHGLVDHTVFLVDLAFVFFLMVGVVNNSGGQPAAGRG